MPRGVYDRSKFKKKRKYTKRVSGYVIAHIPAKHRPLFEALKEAGYIRILDIEEKDL